MKRIEYSISPRSILESVLPWFLEHSSMFLKYAIIGMWEFGIPDDYSNIVINSRKQYKKLFSEYVWETVITVPALSENNHIANEDEFWDSPYQVYLHYYDGNFLNVWFKDEALANAFVEHMKQGTVVYPTSIRKGSLSRKDCDNFSIWKDKKTD